MKVLGSPQAAPYAGGGGSSANSLPAIRRRPSLLFTTLTPTRPSPTWPVSLGCGLPANVVQTDGWGCHLKTSRKPCRVPRHSTRSLHSRVLTAWGLCSHRSPGEGLGGDSTLGVPASWMPGVPGGPLGTTCTPLTAERPRARLTFAGNFSELQGPSPAGRPVPCLSLANLLPGLG